MKYYIVAGEASGDLHGSNLMKGLYAEDPEAEIRFWGGDLMEAACAGRGALVRHYRDGAVMGISDQQPFLWCQDLSAYDSILDYGTRIPILGDHLSLFALLMALTMWFYSKMTIGNQPSGNDPSAQSMRFMSLWMMPIMMFFICNNLSAALSYYYLLSNLFMMLQNWILRKFFVKPEEVLAKLKAAENKPVPKSKWQQRLEEAQRMQQAQLKEQQKKQQRRR